eukprot:gene455-574_t
MPMPADAPAIVITQHMPPGFTTSFANRLNPLCRIRVQEAQHGQRILPGHAYIAPGGTQFHVARSGANYVAVVDDGPAVNRHKPSVEVLFKSAADCGAGPHALAGILTGMGKDGAAGMLEMKNAGAYNFAQDEASCVVFGMPRMAIQHGAAHEVLPLTQIAHALAFGRAAPDLNPESDPVADQAARFQRGQAAVAALVVGHHIAAAPAFDGRGRHLDPFSRAGLLPQKFSVRLSTA